MLEIGCSYNSSILFLLFFHGQISYNTDPGVLTVCKSMHGNVVEKILKYQWVFGLVMRGGWSDELSLRCVNTHLHALGGDLINGREINLVGNMIMNVSFQPSSFTRFKNVFDIPSYRKVLLNCEMSLAFLMNACYNFQSTRDVDNKLLRYVISYAQKDGSVNLLKKRDMFGFTILHDVLIQKSLDFVYDITSILLEFGADVNARSFKKDTPLHALMYNIQFHLEDDPKCPMPESTLKLLLDSGANVNYRNKEMRTPLDVAQKYGFLHRIKHLLPDTVDHDPKAW